MHNQMKKILFITIVVFLGVDTFAQREVIDTLFRTSVSKDTTVFRVFKRDVAYIEFDLGGMAANDTLSIGMSANKLSLEPVVTSVGISYPWKVTLADCVCQVNGTTRYRVALYGFAWPSKYIGFRIKYAGAAASVKPSIIYNP
jgi:hypothetical protein